MCSPEEAAVTARSDIRDTILWEGFHVVRHGLEPALISSIRQEAVLEYRRQDAEESPSRLYRDGVIEAAEIKSIDELGDAIASIQARIFPGEHFVRGFSCVRRVAGRHGGDAGGPVWSNYTGWHLDAEYFDCDENFTLNFWIPLDNEVGRERPGIAFIPMSFEEIHKITAYNVSTEPTRDQYGRTMRFGVFVNELVERHKELKQRVVVPVVGETDIIIFSNWAPHVSYMAGGATSVRYSVEYRVMYDFFAPDIADASRTPMLA